ncbi:MAG: hypothetical protein IPK63_12005 [Candidatus Competibacteraceae bacterium]|nr:hypothetical protein [Candidatus Competibacteraceae bacterium]
MLARPPAADDFVLWIKPILFSPWLMGIRSTSPCYRLQRFAAVFFDKTPKLVPVGNRGAVSLLTTLFGRA